MTLVWDQPGTRVYETGIDKAVIYLSNGVAVPWSGLRSVNETTARESDPTYFDGMKINDTVVIGDFSGTITAITYPTEMTVLEGYASPREGLYLGEQRVKTFDMVYRTMVGTDTEGMVYYKLHILYNLVAIASDKQYDSISDSSDFTEFEWDVSATPVEVPGFRPTAHMVIDSRHFNPELLEILEDMLYGTDDIPAHLMPLPDLLAFLTVWYRIRIVDHGDGTWSAIASEDGLIVPDDLDPTEVVINEATIEVIDADSYIISDTLVIVEMPDMTFVDNGDGTWTATVPDELASVTVDGYFEIDGTNAIFLNPHTWRVTDT